nr:MAG TPA: hypothetical protein [Caudoviricetes sp.]
MRLSCIRSFSGERYGDPLSRGARRYVRNN